MAINSSPTGPLNNSIHLFMGNDDYMFTRSFAQWLDRPYQSMKKLQYTDIYTTETFY